MKKGRSSLLFGFLFFLLGAAPAAAGWFDREERSGLDLEGGFDRNTVQSVSGATGTFSPAAENRPALVELRRGDDLYLVVLGPQAFWPEANSIAHQEDVSVRGSLAQGRDGQTYLFAETVTVGSDEIRLRSSSGTPLWRGGATRPAGSRPQRPHNYRGGH